MQAIKEFSSMWFACKLGAIRKAVVEIDNDMAQFCILSHSTPYRA